MNRCRRRCTSPEGKSSRVTSDAGVATLEAVIIFPVLLFATFLLVQAVLYFMAHTAVTNAAQIGLETARAQSSSASVGQGAATSYLATQSVLDQSSVTVSRGAETVTVTAQGTAPSLVPFDLPQLRSHLTGPVEKVTTP